MYAQEMTVEQSVTRGVMRFGGFCAMCKVEVRIDLEAEYGGFRDLKSAREFGISGLDQKCQDLIFGGGP